MLTFAQDIFGPRVPRTELRTNFPRYFAPTALLVVAAVVLGASFFQPYWHMTLHAPQYPKGLHVSAYLNRLVGDVREIDGLNHYIGMRPLNDAARFERSSSVLLIGVMVLLITSAVLIHS